MNKNRNTMISFVEIIHDGFTTEKQVNNDNI